MKKYLTSTDELSHLFIFFTFIVACVAAEQLMCKHVGAPSKITPIKVNQATPSALPLCLRLCN